MTITRLPFIPVEKQTIAVTERAKYLCTACIQWYKLLLDLVFCLPGNNDVVYEKRGQDIDPEYSTYAYLF